jgi:NosR/NirI family nitrous oxide reductase transcriptional regulator
LKTGDVKVMYKYLIIIILLIAIAISGGRDSIFADKNKQLVITLADVKPLFLEATKLVTNKQGIVEIWQAEERIGQGLISTKYIDNNYGYADIVPVLIGINNYNKVVGILILENRETKDYLWYIYEADFLNKWNGLSSKEASLLEVDAVSRATETSKAIIKAVKASTSIYTGAGTYAEIKHPVFSGLKDILFLFVVVLSIVFAYYKAAKHYRLVYLIIIVISMGIIINKSLSLGIMHNWVVKEIPWQANWQVILLFLITVILSFLGKPKFYCSYLCPMGALQEIINKASPLKKKRMPKIAKKIKLKESYFILIVAVLLLGFLPNLYHFEPFLLFSFQVIGYGLIIFGIFIIILSIFFVKPWCAMCPTGACLDIITPKKIKK